MTLHDKVLSRVQAVMAHHNRRATGLVVDEATYRELYNEPPWTAVFIAAEYQRVDKGDTYMGLEVSISRRKGTLTVY